MADKHPHTPVKVSHRPGSAPLPPLKIEELLFVNKVLVQVRRI